MIYISRRVVVHEIRNLIKVKSSARYHVILKKSNYAHIRHVLLSPPMDLTINSKRFLLNLFNYCEFEDLDADSRLKFPDTLSSKQVLFPLSQDPDLQRITNSDIQGLLQYAGSLNTLTIEQASQAIVTFYDMKKPSILGFYEDDASYSILNDNGSSVTFDKVLLVINNEFRKLPNCALVNTLLALSRLKVSERDCSLVEKLLIECCQRVPTLSLAELSKVSSVIKGSNLNFKYFYYSSVISAIPTFINNCDNEQMLKQVAVCLNNTCTIASVYCINKFGNEVKKFLAKNQQMSFTTALACLSVLGKHEWRDEYSDIQRELLTFLIDIVPQLIAPELSSLFWKLVACRCNVKDIIPVLEKRVLELVKQSTNILEKLVLLSCTKSNISKFEYKYEVNTYLTECLKEVDVNDELQVQLALSILFNIYPIKQEAMVETFIDHNFNVVSDNSLMHSCRSYLLWKWSQNEIILNRTLPDKSALEILENKVKSAVIITEFSFFISIWIARFCSTVPDKHLNKVINVLPQCGIFSLSMISLSLNLVIKSVPPEKTEKLLQLNYSLFDTCSKRLSACDNLADLIQLLLMISDARYRASTFKLNKNVYEKSFLDFYDRFIEMGSLNPMNITAICKLMRNGKVFHPHLLDIMAKTIVEKSSQMYDGTTISKLLSSCYLMNYAPHVSNFFSECQDILISQNEHTSCSDILTSALSLGLFQALNENLIHLIFSEDFLKRLERESSSSTGRQSQDLRFPLATLNRLVNLDYPQVSLPCLHEEFFEKFYSRENDGIYNMKPMEADVFHFLKVLLQGDQCLRIKPSMPYNMPICFECQVDKNDNPIAYSDEEMQDLVAQKVAIDILWKKDLCRNVPRIIGSVALKHRHLEIMGYKVVQIPYYEWYSNRNQDERFEYIQSKIFNK